MHRKMRSSHFDFDRFWQVPAKNPRNLLRGQEPFCGAGFLMFDTREIQHAHNRCVCFRKFVDCYARRGANIRRKRCGIGDERCHERHDRGREPQWRRRDADSEPKLRKSWKLRDAAHRSLHADREFDGKNGVRQLREQVNGT
jgi:hypothetical protein